MEKEKKIITKAKEEKDRIEKIISNSYQHYMFVNSYDTLYKMLDSIEEINGLPEKIMHDFILTTIETVTNDLLELNCELDKYNSAIINFKSDELKDKIFDMTEYQKLKMKLRIVNNLTILTEKCLEKLLEICLFNDNIKYAIKLEIPALFENIYGLINAEEELKQFIFENIIDNYQIKKTDKLKIINDSINNFVENAEEFIDLENIDNKYLVNEFYKARAKMQKNSQS